MTRLHSYTFGAEFELADWDRRQLPPWLAFDERDVSMVNSNGIAVDPRGELYHLGGELLAQPSTTPGGVAEQMAVIKGCQPGVAVNYRSNLHVHVHVPGLAEDLEALKKLQSYVCQWVPQLLPVLEPIPKPLKKDYPEADAYAGARKRWARRKISHHKVLSTRQLVRQLAARTPQEFFEAEALHEPTGRLLWATCPRAAVNLRQLLQTDTVEFRHFPGTTDPEEVLTCVQWAEAFMRLALDGGGSPVRYYQQHYVARRWPQFQPYSHWHEVRYLQTCRKYLPPEQCRANIARILAEDAAHAQD